MNKMGLLLGLSVVLAAGMTRRGEISLFIARVDGC
jgi:hypothetical protein